MPLHASFISCHRIFLICLPGQVISLQLLMVLSCYRIMYKHLSRFLRHCLICSHPPYLPLFVLTKWLLPIFLLTKTTPHGPISVLLITHLPLLNPICISQFPYCSSHLTLLPSYYLWFILTPPFLSPHCPTFHLKPTVRTKYL